MFALAMQEQWEALRSVHWLLMDSADRSPPLLDPGF